MTERIRMSSPEIDESDVQAVVEVLRSGTLSLGTKIVAFEDAICQYLGVRHAVAVSSGTAALHLVVRSLGIGAGDEVLLPSFSFAASLNVLLYEGAKPVFCDIEGRTFNLDPASAERRITPRTRAILAVDIFGHPADWEALHDIATRHNLLLIDDSCEAFGAEYRGTKVGQFGNAAAFSFYPNKPITTGEGGVITTNDSEIARLTRCLRNQGRSEMGSWLEHERLGFNYRLNEMSAALGLSQLRRIEPFLEARKRVAELYSERLRTVRCVHSPWVAEHVGMSWFVYVITLEEGIDRTAVVAAMQERQIPVRCYFSPLHLQGYISRYTDCRAGDLPVTESVAKRTLALPFHNRLSKDEVDEVVDALEDAVSRSYSKSKNHLVPKA
jgi:perosamine synthetase